MPTQSHSLLSKKMQAAKTIKRLHLERYIEYEKDVLYDYVRNIVISCRLQPGTGEKP